MIISRILLQAAESPRRARVAWKPRTQTIEGLSAGLTANDLKAMMVAGGSNWSISGSLRLLATANKEMYASSRSSIRPVAAAMVRNVVKSNLEEFKPIYLTNFVNQSSNIGALGKESLESASRRVRAKLNNLGSVCEADTEDRMRERDEWAACALSLWVASLAQGVSTTNVHAVGLSGLDIVKPDLATLARLSWCIYNDSMTRGDPSIRARVDEMIERHISILSLKDLVELLHTESSQNEFEIVERAVQQRIAQAVTSETDLKGNNKIASQLLRAWTDQRMIPENIELFQSVVSRCLRQRMFPSIVFECLAVLNYPKMNPAWDAGALRSALVSSEHCPGMTQLNSLALSFASLGFDDIESVSFLASHLQAALVEKNPKYAFPSDWESGLWKIGAWYCTLLASENQMTLAAVMDSYKELVTRIASGMWDAQGEFVTKESRQNIPPPERSLRTAIAQSLSSLGIANMQGIHIVNTPYVAHLFLPDRQMAVQFISQTRDVLSDNRLVGSVGVMQRVIASRKVKVRVVNVEEWEQKFLNESQQEFLASLLAMVNQQ